MKNKSITRERGKRPMAKRFSFDRDLPEAVFGEDLQEDNLRRRVQEITTLSLFKNGNVSSGLAAEMLGITRQEFLQLLHDKGLPYFDFTGDELEKEFEAVEELKQKLT
jgi:predicted HTH domain antitoxin